MQRRVPGRAYGPKQGSVAVPQEYGPRLAVILSDLFYVHLSPEATRSEAYFNPDDMFSEVRLLACGDHPLHTPPNVTVLKVDDTNARAVFEEIQPDIIRVMGGGIECDLACRFRLPDVPVIASLDYRPPPTIRESVRYADQVWCMSDAARRSAIKARVRANRIRILPNRVDRGVFNPSVDNDRVESIRAQLPQGDTLLYVGRLTPDKNPGTLLKAVAHLPQRFHAVFISHDDPSDLRTQAADLGITARCHWRSDVEKRDLPAWYAAASCLCIPNRRESTANQLLEAATCGAVIITTDIPPANEFLRHGISAYLCRRPADSWEFARAVREVVDDEEYHRLLSTGAVAAARPFDSEHVDQVERRLYFDAFRLDPHQISYDEVWWRRSYELKHVLHNPPATVRRWLRDFRRNPWGNPHKLSRETS